MTMMKIPAQTDASGRDNQNSVDVSAAELPDHYKALRNSHIKECIWEIFVLITEAILNKTNCLQALLKSCVIECV